MSTNRKEILAGLAEILEEVFDTNPSDVTEDKSFTDDLGVDSLSMAEVLAAAEDKFSVRIPDAQLSKLATVGDVVEFIVRAA